MARDGFPFSKKTRIVSPFETLRPPCELSAEPASTALRVADDHGLARLSSAKWTVIASPLAIPLAAARVRLRLVLHHGVRPHAERITRSAANRISIDPRARSPPRPTPSVPEEERRSSRR
jgi:hypothetical protein